MMEIDADIALEVASHEGLVRQAYKDSVGVWTWSVGLTSKSGHRVRRYINNPQPLEHCLAVYVWVLRNYADEVEDAFGDLTKAQFTAALSFHWNTGAIKRAKWVDHWNAGNRSLARKSIMNWKSPPEIIERREAERDLFFKGVWNNNGMMTEYTRVTSSHTVDWSSARRINIRKEIDEAIRRQSV